MQNLSGMSKLKAYNLDKSLLNNNNNNIFKPPWQFSSF